jgi:hypothetical protein
MTLYQCICLLLKIVSSSLPFCIQHVIINIFFRQGLIFYQLYDSNSRSQHKILAFQIPALSFLKRCSSLQYSNCNRSFRENNKEFLRVFLEVI